MGLSALSTWARKLALIAATDRHDAATTASSCAACRETEEWLRFNFPAIWAGAPIKSAAEGNAVHACTEPQR